MSADSEWLDREITVYPNPASSQVIVEFSTGDINVIRLLDLTGRLVMSFRPENSLATLNLDALASGTYLIQVDTKNGIYTQKILVE